MYLPGKCVIKTVFERRYLVVVAAEASPFFSAVMTFFVGILFYHKDRSGSVADSPSESDRSSRTNFSSPSVKFIKLFYAPLTCVLGKGYYYNTYKDFAYDAIPCNINKWDIAHNRHYNNTNKDFTDYDFTDDINKWNVTYSGLYL